MSTPHIAWAFAQRGLTTVQRVVLIALAERANGERTCFPSFPTLATDCEVSERAVIAAVQYLQDGPTEDMPEKVALIEVVTDPAERAAILGKAGARITTRSNIYRILRPDDTAPRAPSRHHNGARHAPSSDHIPAPRAPSTGNPAPRAPSTPFEGANGASQGCSKRHHEHAPRAPESLNESLHEKKRAAQAQDSGGKEASEGQQALQGEVLPPRQNIPGLPGYDPTLTSDGQPKATAESVHRAASLAIQAITRKAYAPGRAPALTPNEQIDIAEQPDRPPPEVRPELADHIAAARRDLAQRAALRLSVHA